jgi:hypothetical protein
MLSGLLSPLRGAFYGCRLIRWSPDAKTNCKCTEWVLDSWQVAVFWLGIWALVVEHGGITKTHRKNYSVSEFYIRCLGWNIWNGLGGRDVLELGQEQWIYFIWYLVGSSGRLFIDGNELRFWKVSPPILEKKEHLERTCCFHYRGRK